MPIECEHYLSETSLTIKTVDEQWSTKGEGPTCTTTLSLLDSQNSKALEVSLDWDLKGITNEHFYGTRELLMGFGFL